MAAILQHERIQPMNLIVSFRLSGKTKGKLR